MKYLLLLLTLIPFLATSQCDLEIYDFHPETLETTIIVHNGFGCNPNDPTDDQIAKFILGITSTQLQEDAVECGLLQPEPGWILQNYITDFVLWDDENAYLGPDGILNTGDTLIFNLFDAQLGESFAEGCYMEALDLGYFDDCIELYIWQINCSNDILGTNNGTDNCVDGIDNGYEYPDVNVIDNIYDVFCATDLTFGENTFEFGCNVWDPEQFGNANDDLWRWRYNPLDIFNQGYSTAHQYTLSTYYNGQLAWSIDYNSDLLDWISVPPNDSQTFFSTPSDPSLIIGSEPLEEIKITITDVYPEELDTSNNTLILTSPEDFIWEVCADEGITELLYIDYECDIHCNDTLAWYDAVAFFDNTGNNIITDFCVNWDVVGGQDIVECFEGELLPGESATLVFSPVTSEGLGGVIIRLETLNGEETDITWGQPISCYQEALATCIYGCTDETAANYDPNAEWDDGSCVYDVFGCTDPTANNYNPLATVNDGSCTYDILGCTDPDALNYNPAANIDDGSCEYPIPGCTDPIALNYNEFATVEDGSCEYLEGCTDPDAINYNSLAIIDNGSCVYPPENCDGSYFAPNTFTPNNDGINDGWVIVVADPDCWRLWNVQIFNRWGGLVWETNQIGDPWRGNMFDGDYYVSDGVYLYKVTGAGWDPTITFKTTGHITIFR